MKKIFSLFAAILFAVSMFAADVTSTMDIPSDATVNTTSFTASDDASWTLTKVCNTQSVGTESEDKYYQIGSGSKSATSMTLTSSSFAGKTVKQIKVKCSSSAAAANAATVTVTSGDISFTAATNTISGSTATTLTFTSASENGEELSNDLVVNLAFAQAQNKNIRIYQIDVLYEGAPSTDPALSVAPVKIDFGTVEQGQEVDDKEVEVTFANLTGAVTYSELEAPFSAQGAIENSGDKITISVSTDEIGEFTKTLTVESEDDEKSVAVEVHVNVKAPARAYQQTIDLTAIEGFADWSTSYTMHEIEGTEAKVVLASANKQTSTITDIPVTKGGDVELILTNSKKQLTAVRLICRQWGTKAQTITLNYSTDGGENYKTFDPAVTSNEFEVEKIGLPAGTDAIKATFSSQSNQVGIVSVSYDLEDKEVPAVERPTIAGATSFQEKVTVTITCETEDAEIRYTLDGSDPDAQATLYTAPFDLEETTTVKAIAIKDDSKSTIAEKVFTAFPTEFTCAEAAEAALSVSGNNVLYADGLVFDVTGFVTEIAYELKDGSMSFWMADEADGENTIEAYKCAITNEEDAPVVGDKVKVTGKLTKYGTTPEFAQGNTCVIVEQKPTSISNNTVEAKAVKVVRDGQIFILKNGQLYNLVGTVVK